jgi:small-conductance mechanosensitive channel
MQDGGRHLRREEELAMKRLRCITALVVALGPLATALGADDGAAVSPVTNEAAAPEIRTAPVVIDGTTLFSVRGASSYSADRRARAIEERIRALAGDRSVAAPSLTLEEGAGVTWITDPRAQRIMGVFEEDAAVESISRSLLAQSYRGRILEAIAAYRADRHPPLLARRAAYALAVALAVILAALASRRAVRWVQAALERRYRARIRDLKVQEFRVVRIDQIRLFLSRLLTLAWAVSVFAMTYAGLRYALSLFPWTRGASQWMRATAIEPVRAMGVGILEAIPGLVFIALLAVITRFVLRLVRLFFDNVASGSVKLRDFDAEWAQPTSRLIRLFVIAFAVVVAYPYIPGSSTNAFKGVSLFIGVIFSLGSSSLIGNIIAGYSMTYRRAFRVGDLISIGEHVGVVEKMRTLVTHLRTMKNEEVIVPNSSILAGEVVNYSSLARESGVILHTTVNIGYDTPWRQVEAMLLDAAERTPGLLREPPPFVLHKSLDGFGVTYEVNVYCATPERRARHYTELHRNILDVFNEHGVQIMTPAYEGDPEQPKIVPKERWYEAPARAPAAPPLRNDALPRDAPPRADGH